MNLELTPPSLQSVSLHRSAPFARMLAISLTLHVFCAAFLILTPGGRGGPAPLPAMMMELGSFLPTAPLMVEPAATSSPSIPVEPEAVPQEPAPSPVTEAPAESAVASSPTAGTTQELPRSTFGIGLASGSFASIGEGTSLHLELKEYYLEMLGKLNERWWQEPASPGRLGNAVLVVVVARSGEVVHCRLARSSGNPAADQALLRAVTDASPLSPLPESYQGDFFEAPLRFTPPLSLLSR